MARNTAGESVAAQAGHGCVVLVMHTTSYNVDAFVKAAEAAGLKAVIASDRCHVLDGIWQWSGDSLVIDFYDPVGSADVIASGAHALPPVKAVIPVGGEAAALVATLASRRLGLTGNAPEAAEAAANKLRMRQLCARAAELGAPLRVPAFTVFPYDADPAPLATVVDRAIGWPCVIKPLLLSASRGVMRADNPATFVAAFSRLHRFLSAPALMNMSDGPAEADIVAGGVGGGDGAHGPEPIAQDEPAAKAGTAPAWIGKRFRASDIDPAEAAALVERAPLDLRVNA